MKRKLKYWIAFVALCVAFFAGGQRAEAANSVKVTGTCKYDMAYKVLELLNEKRVAQGKGELVMDEDLLQAAMMRGAEITVSFSHTRPNGEECCSACSKMYAENIAYGYTSAAAVMNGWYTSPGHKENMMEESYQSIGIGCFSKDGILYWVQCFGIEEADKVSKPSNVKQTYQVSKTGGVETKIVKTNPLSTKVSSFKATAGKKKLTLKWKKKSGISGYEIQISTGKTFQKKDTYTIGKGTTKKVITKYKGKKLKAKKKYYVRIRAYKQTTATDGTVKKTYSKWNTIHKKTK